MSVGERIRQIRKREKLSLDKFGARIGLKQGIISMMENGKSSVTDQTIISICREFNVNEAWLRTGEGEMFAEPPLDPLEKLLQERGLPQHLRGLLVRISNLPPASQEAVERQLKIWVDEIKQEPVLGAESMEPQSDDDLRKRLESEIENHNKYKDAKKGELTG